MAKKNTEELAQLQEAITQIKKIRIGIQVNNPVLTREMDLAEHRLLEEFFTKSSQTIRKPKVKT
jgi:hypothetical protein